MSSTFTAVPSTTGFGLDKGWILTSAGFVFLMQIGLGLLEIGSIRRKNSRIVWYKILLNLINGIWWWYILGFAWAYGWINGSFLGAERYYAGGGWSENDTQGVNGDAIAGPGYQQVFARFVWTVSVAMVATTIATGIVTERITMRAVVLFNFAMNLCSLPFIFAWTFALGFLANDIGYRDYAGSMVVFGAGAFAGLAGLLFIKPRYNRYQRFPVVLAANPTGIAAPPNAELRPLYGSEAQRNLPSSAFDRVSQPAAPITYGGSINGIPNATAFTVDNVVRVRSRLNEDVYEHFGVTDYGLVCLGAIIFFIGYIFFCGGASQGLQVFVLYNWAERAAVAAVLGAVGGGLGTLLFVSIFLRKRPIRENYATIARAFVAGAVAVAADAGNYAPFAGIVIGLLGALSYVIMSYLFYHLRWDDPAEFFPMFGAPAICGIICAAFLNIVNGIFYSNGTEGEVLLWQLLGGIIIIGWAFGVGVICFALLRALKALRISLKTEIIGYDYIDGGRHLEEPATADVLAKAK